MARRRRSTCGSSNRNRWLTRTDVSIVVWNSSIAKWLKRRAGSERNEFRIRRAEPRWKPELAYEFLGSLRMLSWDAALRELVQPLERFRRVFGGPRCRDAILFR